MEQTRGSKGTPFLQEHKWLLYLTGLKAWVR